MVSIETLEEFYKSHPHANPRKFAINNADRGHFNIFSRNGWCRKQRPFSRRDFYKIALVIGTGRLHYADRKVEVVGPALVFASPLVPASWEPVSEEQDGWFCLFTDGFIESHEHKTMLQDFPLFNPGAKHVVSLTDSQLILFSELFRRMDEEMDSEYVHKYDLLRHYLHIIMHEAVKIDPPQMMENGINAATRLTTQFLELLERQFPIDSPGRSLQLRTANDFAQGLSVHTNHLNRSVKETTGKTTTQYISERY